MLFVIIYTVLYIQSIQLMISVVLCYIVFNVGDNYLSSFDPYAVYDGDCSLYYFVHTSLILKRAKQLLLSKECRRAVSKNINGCRCYHEDRLCLFRPLIGY